MHSLRNSMNIQRMAIDSVTEHKSNPRVHSHKQRRKIASIRRYGQVVPILVAPDLCIIDGHALWYGLKEVGFREIDVLIVANQSPAELRALRLAINRLPQDSAWDNPRLRAEFTELLELDFDLEDTGFDAHEIDFVLKLDMPSANVAEDFDSIPKPQKVAIARPGDIFQLGPHSVGCGDARDQRFIDLVRGGRPAHRSAGAGGVSRRLSGRLLAGNRREHARARRSARSVRAVASGSRE
jgi:hypothetical protein